jgi:serine/threonine protein kinase
LFTLGFPVPLITDEDTQVSRPWTYEERPEGAVEPADLPPAPLDPLGETAQLSGDGRAKLWMSSPAAEHQIIGNKYAVEERIGQGGQGRVYRVKHLDLGKVFALKLMRTQLSDDEQARKDFFREARLASGMSHPGIVSIVDFGQDPELGVYMVMELVEGVSLKHALAERGRFQLRPACDIILQIADAIQYVHQKGVVHCDLKSENVLVATAWETGRRSQRVKLLDFGLARPSTSTTQSVTVAGTPSYIAPERIRGARPAPSMDIYGLGIMFYELLTGAPPFTGTLDEVLRNHLQETPVAPSVILGKDALDQRIEDVLMRSLAKRPEDRPDSVGALVYELRTAMEMMGIGRTRRAKPRQEPRNELTDVLFAECPLPLAALDGEGAVVACNKAFAIFLVGEPVDMRGVSLSKTALPEACPTFLDELARVQREGAAAQVPIETPQAKLLAWLTPAPTDGTVFCAIHVLER